jgi:hypothetical protein
MATSTDVLTHVNTLYSSSGAKADSPQFSDFDDYMNGRVSALGAARGRFAQAYPTPVERPSFPGVLASIATAQTRTNNLAPQDASVQAWGDSVNDAITSLDNSH